MKIYDKIFSNHNTTLTQNKTVYLQIISNYFVTLKAKYTSGNIIFYVLHIIIWMHSRKIYFWCVQ